MDPKKIQAKEMTTIEMILSQKPALIISRI
jgi:hypothetical protein